VNGRTAPEVLAGYLAEVHPASPLITGLPKMATLLVGNNDIGQGHTAAQIYADIKSIWAQLRADGHYIVAMSVPDSTNWSDPQQLVRADLNALIEGDQTLFDFIFHIDEYLTNMAEQLDSDGTHFTATFNETLLAPAIHGELIAAFNW